MFKPRKGNNHEDVNPGNNHEGANPKRKLQWCLNQKDLKRIAIEASYRLVNRLTRVAISSMNRNEYSMQLGSISYAQRYSRQG